MQIARAKGVPLSACDVLWGFDLPRLGVDEDLRALAAALRKEKVAVVFLDPAYLCLLSGNPDLQASNLFQVGPLLLAVSRVCLEVGATLVLVHHSTKPAGMVRMQAGEPMELEDLAFSGFAEFARQWALVNRRQKYEPGSGKHCLWMNIGGSAGHSGCWGLDVDEGKLAEDFTGRRWLVQVQSMEVAVKGIAEAKEKKKEAGKKAKLVDVRERLVQILERFPQGETLTVIAEAVGTDRRLVQLALGELLEDGRVVLASIEKQCGRSKKLHPAWRLLNYDDFQRAKLVKMGLAPGNGTGAPIAPPEAGNDVLAMSGEQLMAGLRQHDGPMVRAVSDLHGPCRTI